jgi:hypothetical protein
VKIWESTHGRTHHSEKAASSGRSVSGFRNYVQRLAFGDDGKRLAATGLPDAGPGGVKVWDLADSVVRLKSR